MADLNGHEAGNGGHSQGKPTAYRDSSTRREAITRVEIPTLLLTVSHVCATENHQFASMCSMTIPTITAAVTVVRATDVLAPSG